jgi:3-deoxy-D-manno-octulosonate 8-phosphate phosphatase (KDO 8-P phosphatase)
MAPINYTHIKLLVLDVDGVLTDGRIVLNAAGQEIKAFHVRDGTGMKYWKRAGGLLAFISGRSAPAVAHRAKELDVDVVKLGAKDKLPAYQAVLKELKLGEDQTAVVGDDLPDLPLLYRCALPIAVADAAEEVRAAAAYVTQAAGGAGAVREIVEMILKQTGAWETILARYRRGGEERAS